MTSARELPGLEQRWIAGALEQARAEAAALTSAAEDHLRIAGRTVRVRYADTAQGDLLGRATRHLRRDPDGPPALTIDCWTAPGPIPEPPAGWPSSGTVHFDDGDVVVNWNASDGTLRAYDRRIHQAWTRFTRPTGAAQWEPVGPFRFILTWWAADNGLQFTHAAAVGRAHGGVLLAGRSGPGKSTTSLACLAAGLDFAGDDSCIIEATDRPWVHGLYLSAKGDARTAALLPDLAEDFARSPFTVEGESVVFADQVRPGAVSRGFPLRGIVVPRLSSEPVSRLSPVGPATALRALAPSTLMQVPTGNRATGLAQMASIAATLPAWELALGPDPAHAAALITDLIDRGTST